MIDEVAVHDEGDERQRSPAGAVGCRRARGQPGGATYEDDDVLTVDEAARLLRIGRNQMYEAIGRGEIPHRRIGRSIRLSRLALAHWLEGPR